MNTRLRELLLIGLIITCLSSITYLNANVIDDTTMPMHTVPNDIKECPICHSKFHIIIQDGPDKKLVGIRCTNPQHYPQLLVMATGRNLEEAVAVWNSRGKER